MQTMTAILECAKMADEWSSIATQPTAFSFGLSAGTMFFPSPGTRVVRESSKILSLRVSLAAIETK